MPINFRHAQKVIYSHLSEKEVTSLSISKLLEQVPGFNRQAFYKQYHNKFYFLGVCINAIVRDELAFHNHPKLKDNFYVLLHHIKREERFYTNVYSLVRNACICDQLQDHLHDFVKEKQKNDIIFSKGVLKKETDAIYKRIYHWVSHNCYEEVKQIYNELGTSMSHVEYLCDSKLRNSEILINFENKYWQTSSDNLS
ncbi:hypothetical protein [Lactobacillus hominis]|uniref:Uncharacterized protein n=1 Tax=Lactobacillus hominis DSM 23910 = CRBIP 24.179 TaxID=1423758 RepID=I7IWA6_9LACO|nr:hypothetical protein [Lactobacillus hominis]KRM86232.1 hypothetical protein FC41_GL000429 [Lactobacillus hominis DSM 23910 = CRBIP 24.179]MCT3348545.1 hypothetical protein [Lactobacillus hominis]CCI82733.1 Putative uncharacterized protein [Lactobacillus hominis DSM 23910 = CRBIP 24.179]